MKFQIFTFLVYKAIENPKSNQPLNKIIKPIHMIRDEQGQAEINPDQLWNLIRSSVIESLNYARQNDLKVSDLGISTHRSTCTLWEADSGRGKESHDFLL